MNGFNEGAPVQKAANDNKDEKLAQVQQDSLRQVARLNESLNARDELDMTVAAIQSYRATTNLNRKELAGLYRELNRLAKNGELMNSLTKEERDIVFATLYDEGAWHGEQVDPN